MTDRALTGAAGEYFVAAELSRRGWLATVTIKNAPRTDVLARRLDSPRLIAIQSKTSASGNQNVRLSERDEAPALGDEWFVCVALGDPDALPTYYVVPRDVIAERIYSDHREWL